jgi:membrane-associated protein
MDFVTEAALDAAASPWVYLVVFIITVLDAFLVVVPSETVIVALAALSASAGSPDLAPLVVVAAAAAVIGDSLTFWAGRAVGISRFGWMRRPRVIRVLDWARVALDRRAAVALLTARFVPFGRIAVNLTAGATGFGYPRFVALTVVAGACWAVYNVLVGSLFGTWLDGNPVLAVACSVVVAVGVGLLVDRASTIVARRRSR